MKHTSHQTRLKQAVMQEFRESVSETPIRKKRARFWFLGVFSATGVASVAAAVAVVLVGSFSRPEVVTAEQLLADARNYFQVLNELGEDEVFHIEMHSVESMDRGNGFEKVSSMKDTVWTDGTLLRRDRYSGEGTLHSSTLMTLDSATSGMEYRFQPELHETVKDVNSGYEMGIELPREVSKTRFFDYPESGSILDTADSVSAGLPHDGSLDEAARGFARQWNAPFALVGETEVDGIPAYHLSASALNRDLIDSALDGSALAERTTTKEYWISREEHRVLRERTTVPGLAQYETMYSRGTVVKEVSRLDLDSWKDEHGITDDELKHAVEFPDKQMSVDGREAASAQAVQDAEPLRVESCMRHGWSREECEQFPTVRAQAVSTWKTCMESEPAETCTQQLYASFDDRAIFNAFCDRFADECADVYAMRME